MSRLELGFFYDALKLGESGSNDAGNIGGNDDGCVPAATDR